MAVVAAFDLDDQVASGDRPHYVNRVHRRFGARVGEPPQRQLEPLGQLPGDSQRVASWLSEVGAARTLPLNGFDDRRVRVPGQRDTVAAVQVDVLVPVDVVE